MQDPGTTQCPHKAVRISVFRWKVPFNEHRNSCLSSIIRDNQLVQIWLDRAIAEA